MKITICVLLFVLQSFWALAEIKNCDDWQGIWGQCETDDDCVVVTNPCGWPTASANKTYAQEASRCNTIAGAALSCVSWSDINGEQHLAKCENGLCVSKPVE